MKEGAMGRRWGVRYIVVSLVFFLFASGFLGFCQKASYQPCTIVFTSPVNGTVLPTGTTTVTINGKVVAGTKAPWKMWVYNRAGTQLAQVPFNSTTGEFSYEATLNDSPYTTLTFEIKDTNFTANNERISIAVGESAEPGADGVVDDAIRVMLNDAFMDQVEIIGTHFINNWKNDLIYGWNSANGSGDSSSPFAGMTPLVPLNVKTKDILGFDIGTVNVDTINLGTVGLGIDIQSGNAISANITVSSNDTTKGLYVHGNYTDLLGTRTHFVISVNSLSVTNAKLRLSVNASNKIVASLDLDNAQISLGNTYVEFGFLGLPLPSWLLNWVISLVKDQILGMLSLDIPIMDANIALSPILGIQMAGWPMNTSTIFTSTDTDMTVDLGISAILVSSLTPLVPDLTKFYATPGDALPTLTTTGNENIQIALKDDIINNIAFVAIQTGLVVDMDVSSILNMSGLSAKVTLDTPPILDFSGAPLGDTLAVYDMGRAVIRNLIIEIYYTNKVLPVVARLSVDVNAALKLNISDDGKYIVGGMDTTQSDCSVMICYNNLVNSINAPTIGKKIANSVVNTVLQSMLKIDIPTIPLYGEDVSVALMGTELNNNALVAKLNITHLD